jgi:phosphatidylserine decarboxylase
VPAHVSNTAVPSGLGRFFPREDLNFLVTNRIPRRYASLFMGWFSRIRSRPLTRVSVAVWRAFDRDLQFEEARTQDFASLRECFIRELKPGARPIDPDPAVVTSPCDAVVGAHGRVRDGQAIQIKGFPYRLNDLFGDGELADRHRHGIFVTLRLRPSMYHRFHAPCEGRVRRVRYISGDTWNVNPIALRRVERLFCRNERAVVPIELPDPGRWITLVPVAAILVAGIRLHCLPVAFNLRYGGVSDLACDASFVKGQELGYFEHGSTIVLFASPDFEFSEKVVEGATIRVGEALLRLRTNL